MRRKFVSCLIILVVSEVTNAGLNVGIATCAFESIVIENSFPTLNPINFVL